MNEKKIYSQLLPILARSIIYTCCGKLSFWGRPDCLPQPTIPDCIEAVSSGRATYAVVPLENALEGSVPLTIDYMFNENDLFINAEAFDSD